MIFRVFGAEVPRQIPEELEEAYHKYKKAKARDQKLVWRAELMRLYDYYYELHISPLLRQYCGGEFVNTNGSLAYWGFNDSKITEEPIANILQGQDVIHVGMDFNVDPMTATFSVKRRIFGYGEKLTVFAEAYLNNSNTYKMRDHILERFPGKKIIVYPDMTGGNRKSSALFTDLDILKKAGFQVYGKSNMLVRDSLNAINTAFIQDRLEIHKSCDRLISDFQKVVRNEYGEIEKEKDSSLTHISDATRYKVDRIFPLKAKSKVYGM